MVTRRDFLAAGLVGIGGLLVAGKSGEVRAQAKPEGAKKSGAELILLGTMGGSRAVRNRCSTSQAIVTNDQLYIIDCGNSVARQAVLAGCELRKLKAVFITHHHDDHNLDYGNLIHLAKMGGLKQKVDAYGPYPLKKMTDLYIEMNDYTSHQSVLGTTPLQDVVRVHEVDLEGAVMQDENVKVTTVRVIHPPVPAFAYRFDTRDRSITISGDTAPSAELVELAQGSDVLVHEVLHKPSVEKLAQRLPQYKGLAKFLLASHTVVEDAGKIAQQAGVKTLVLTHFVPGDDPSVTDDMWREGAAKFFKGNIVVGKDLIRI